MEFTHGRRERFYSEEEDQEESSSKHPAPFIPSSSPSSSSTSSSSTAFRWSTDGPPGGGGGGGGDVAFVEKEHMFDKVVTPSDVGKLNRLVIPKQHAEKYFPLDAAGNEKGLLLSFEDRNGKPWRFRYSYWNSSQSYVMTKGWSRFVKEKRLDAGDTVSFGRGVGESARERLFIDWRRRPEAHDPQRLPRIPIPVTVPFPRSAGPWGGRLLFPPVYDPHPHHRPCYGYNNAAGPSGGGGGGGGRFLFFRSGVPQTGVQALARGGGGGGDGGAVAGVPMVLDSVPLVHGQAAAKRVRLFGVNLDCPDSDGGDSDGRNNALSLRMPHFQPRSALPLFQLPHGCVESSAASSSSSSPPKEQHSPLDHDM